MFDNDLFTEWLDKRSSELMDKIGRGDPLSSEEMIILVLKAQTNHFDHLDKEVKEDISEVKSDIREVKEGLIHLDQNVKEDIREIKGSLVNLDQNVKENLIRLDQNVKESIRDLIIQMDKRFEQVDKRFEQVDKRFERVYRYMQWQTGIFFALFAGIYTPILIGYFR